MAGDADRIKRLPCCKQIGMAMEQPVAERGERAIVGAPAGGRVAMDGDVPSTGKCSHPFADAAGVDEAMNLMLQLFKIILVSSNEACLPKQD